MKNVHVSILQLDVSDRKESNLSNLSEQMKKIKDFSPDFTVLGEMFNCPYDISCFKDFSESEDSGITVKYLSSLAKEYSTVLIGGSIPENDSGKIFNTSFIFSKEGKIIGKHRKVHLFDVNLRREGDEVTFKESIVLSPGNSATVIDTDICPIGICICYDARFPELTRKMALMGAQIVFIPAAFNNITGPAHWELTMRSRALDNQLFVCACSTALNSSFTYHSYGHSMAIDPWGKVLGSLEYENGILNVELDLELISEIRSKLPLLKHRREEVYSW